MSNDEMQILGELSPESEFPGAVVDDYWHILRIFPGITKKQWVSLLGKKIVA